MSYIYGFTKNRYLVFGVVLAIFLSSVYIAGSKEISIVGVVIIISFVTLLMMAIKVFVERMTE